MLTISAYPDLILSKDQCGHSFLKTTYEKQIGFARGLVKSQSRCSQCLFQQLKITESLITEKTLIIVNKVIFAMNQQSQHIFLSKYLSKLKQWCLSSNLWYYQLLHGIVDKIITKCTFYKRLRVIEQRSMAQMQDK